MTRNINIRWVSADSLARSDNWDVNVCVRSSEARVGSVALGDLGVRLLEGVRTNAAEEQDVFLYRPSHIVGMTLAMDGGPGTSVPAAYDKAVGPGDIVVSKFLPLRAAWVTQETPRYAVDSNCIRIVGLDVAYGFWVAAVLNHPLVRAAWNQHTRGTTIPRIGMKDLKRQLIPALADEGARLAELWLGLESDRERAWKELNSLCNRAEELVSDITPLMKQEQKQCFQPPQFLSESWLPSHVAMRHIQDEMSRNRWQQLRAIGAIEKSRLRDKTPTSGRLLRLSDAEGTLEFRLPKDEVLKEAGFRFYERPLQPEEVLLSLMGTSPKVVFNHPPREETILVSDRWARLHSIKYPGAVALLLMTSVVRWQLRSASSGFAQQFVTTDDLESVRLPSIEIIEAERMHRLLCKVMEQLSNIREKQKTLISEVEKIITDHLGSMDER